MGLLDARVGCAVGDANVRKIQASSKVVNKIREKAFFTVEIPPARKHNHSLYKRVTDTNPRGMRRKRVASFFAYDSWKNKRRNVGVSREFVLQRRNTDDNAYTSNHSGSF